MGDSVENQVELPVESVPQVLLHIDHGTFSHFIMCDFLVQFVIIWHSIAERSDLSECSKVEPD